MVGVNLKLPSVSSSTVKSVINSWTCELFILVRMVILRVLKEPSQKLDDVASELSVL